MKNILSEREVLEPLKKAKLVFRKKPDKKLGNHHGLCHYFKIKLGLSTETVRYIFGDKRTKGYSFCNGSSQSEVYCEMQKDLYYERSDWCIERMKYFQLKKKEVVEDNKIKVYYCSKCNSLKIARCYKNKYCTTCRNGDNIKSFYTEVKIPTPNIKRNTLIRVWTEDPKNKLDLKIGKFLYFNDDNYVVVEIRKYANSLSRVAFANWEFIKPEEIDPKK